MQSTRPNLPEVPISVPESLRSLHAVVKRTRDAMEGAQLDDHGRLRIEPRVGIARVLVSKDQLNRALRILQGVLTGAEAQGYSVVPAEDIRGAYEAKPGVGLQIEGFVYPVEIVESTKQVALSDEEIEHWKNNHPWGSSVYDKVPSHKSLPSGDLQLCFPRSLDRGARWRWEDGKTASLESKLGSVLPTLAGRVPTDTERVKADEQRELEREAARQEREANARINHIHKKRVARADAQIGQWQRSVESRNFATQLREKLADCDPADRERLTDWSNWIDRYAAALDPLTEPSEMIGLDDQHDLKDFYPGGSWQ